MYGDSVSVDMTATNDALAARLGVRSIDQVGPAVNEVQIAQIQFGHGSTKLGGSDYNVLEQVAATWQQTSGFIRVIGHASMRTGNMSLEQHMAVNRRVSEGRAAAVVSRLLSLGVSPDAIFVGADGSADPRYYEGVPAGEAGNRRVEIIWITDRADQIFSERNSKTRREKSFRVFVFLAGFARKWSGLCPSIRPDHAANRVYAYFPRINSLCPISRNGTSFELYAIHGPNTGPKRNFREIEDMLFA